MKVTSSTAKSTVMSRRGMPRMLGRYELLGALARGGMATVYLARQRGEAGFQRLFAVKVLHDHLAEDEDFVNMLLDEARIAARLHHPNVVPIVDLGSQEGIYYVVMEYIEGCSLSVLLKKFPDERPTRLLIRVALDVLAGLHAAHSIKDDDGNLMNLVHRDVSPQNVMVGVDGTARLTDFGIARAESRIMSTRPGHFKGKLAFMAPEQIMGGEKIDRRTDLFASGVMLWSALTGRRLFQAETDALTLSNILQMTIPPPSTVGLKPPEVLDPLIERALERDPDKRFQTAQDMEEALHEIAVGSASLGSRREVAEWVEAGFGEELEERRRAIRDAFDDGRPAADSLISVSGMMPTIGSFTPSHSQSQPDPSSRSPLIIPASPASTADPSAAGSKRKRALIFAGMGVGVALILGIALATRGPAPLAEAGAKETAAVTPPVAAVAEAPAVAEPAPTAVEEPAPPAVAESSPAAEEPAPTTKVPRAVVRRIPPPPPRNKPPAEATAEPVAEPAPPPPKKTTRWDKDAPGLPPE